MEGWRKRGGRQLCPPPLQSLCCWARARHRPLPGLARRCSQGPRCVRWQRCPGRLPARLVLPRPGRWLGSLRQLCHPAQWAVGSGQPAGLPCRQLAPRRPAGRGGAAALKLPQAHTTGRGQSAGTLPSGAELVSWGGGSRGAGLALAWKWSRGKGAWGWVWERSSHSSPASVTAASLLLPLPLPGCSSSRAASSPSSPGCKGWGGARARPASMALNGA